MELCRVLHPFHSNVALNRLDEKLAVPIGVSFAPFQSLKLPYAGLQYLRLLDASVQMNDDSLVRYCRFETGTQRTILVQEPIHLVNGISPPRQR